MRSNFQDAFQPVYIVTQTEGMNNWVKLQMAKKLGIAANCKFLKPNDIIHKIYYTLGGTSTQTLSPENMNWLLYKLLGEVEFIKGFPAISSYYNNEEDDKEVKRMGLAEKVSDLFDQYQIYRMEMIERWNNNEPAQHSEEEWQRHLWIAAHAITGASFPDKSKLGKEIAAALKNPDHAQRLVRKMPRVYFFGISVITEYHLQIFEHLAEHIHLNFLLLNPAPGIYWFDDKSEKKITFLKRIGKLSKEITADNNQLLLGWGKIIQDTFSLLFKNESLINAYDEIDGSEPGHDTLLHKIQHAISQNKSFQEEEKFTEAAIQDVSIVINSCYSPAREVECLYNYLVYLVDKKGVQLSPRDIVVMVSDINLYSSYIKAIFNNAPYKFHYTIADESYAVSDSISHALHAVLSITEEDFSAEEVIRLMDSSFIRQRFNISDPSFIRNIIDAANIRSGIEGKREDDSRYISWTYGLKRIMYGICMLGTEEFGEGAESFFPLDIVEGNAAHDVIRFVHFSELLIQSLKERKSEKTIMQWVEYINQTLHTFVCTSEETTDEDYILLLQQLENYHSSMELFTEPISYEVFMHRFMETLAGETKKESFAVGGITFCSLIPMRSIPFKVVALLGLNFDKFPRKENSIGFNLIDKEKRKGDRNVKENDKHLFLETLLSAKEHLYISYVGQSLKDNSSFPPSTLVDELVDHITQNALQPANVRNTLITKQPLHPFSQRYNPGTPRLYSYLNGQQKAIKELSKETTASEINFNEISLDSLVSFLKNPIQGYYNKVLGIYYNHDEISLRDTELFELDTLQKWSLKNALLTIPDDKVQEHTTVLIKTGGLPLKNMAAIEVDKLQPEVQKVKTLLEPLIGEEDVPSTLGVDVKLGEITLTGKVKGIYDDKMIVISWSKSEIKYLLDAYIRYMALIASGHTVSLHFVSCHNQAVFPSIAINKTEAVHRLEEIVDVYMAGHKNIIPFDSSFKIKPSDIENLDQPTFDKKVKDKFENFKFPCNDTYMNKEYEKGFFHSEYTFMEYRQAAAILLVPLDAFFPGYFK